MWSLREFLLEVCDFVRFSFPRAIWAVGSHKCLSVILSFVFSDSHQIAHSSG